VIVVRHINLRVTTIVTISSLIAALIDKLVIKVFGDLLARILNNNFN